MKFLLLSLLVLPAIALSLIDFPASNEPANKVVNVSSDQATATSPLAVLELFTSQGCSSCPPADALLSELDERAKAGENIIALSYHVDYWNYLGWTDPFSDAAFSSRQGDYARHIGARTYTPQLVINGTTALVGSRKAEVRALVNRTLKTNQATLKPELSISSANGKIITNYALKGDLAGYRLTALLTQHKATSSVNRGENRGRELLHHNVVRVMKHATAAEAGSFELEIPDGLTADDVAVVLLVQNTASHAIAGSARAKVSGR